MYIFGIVCFELLVENIYSCMLLIIATVGFRCGTIVSGDSSGSVQFWDAQFGTLLQAHSHHKGDVNALAAAPNHNRVFSAGSDGQVHARPVILMSL